MGACSTIMNGPKQDVRIKVTPSDAEIMVDGMVIGKGYVKSQLARGSVHTVDVTMNGYQSAHIETGIGVEGWYWANAVLFFGYAWIDLITNAAYSIDPDSIIINLSPDEPIFRTYDTNRRWIARLPVYVILTAIAVLSVWFFIGTIQRY